MAVVGGQWSVVSGRWSVVGGQWSVRRTLQIFCARINSGKGNLTTDH